MTKYSPDDVRITLARHGIIVHDPVPLNRLNSVGDMAAALRFDQLDAGLAQVLGAVLVFVSHKSGDAWRAELAGEAADVATGTPVDRAVQTWIRSGNGGSSSHTIVRVLGGQAGLAELQRMRHVPQPSHPHDPADLMRCVSLLDAVKGAGGDWRARLHEVAAAYPNTAWPRLVEAWAELESMLAEEAPSGRAPKTYARMKELGA